MSDSNFLIALAMMEQNNKRAMPIAGKSLSAELSMSTIELNSPDSNQLFDQASNLAFELLLRIWKRTDDGPLRRASGQDSLLLVEIPMNALPEELPSLKSQWIRFGDDAIFTSALRDKIVRGWTIDVEKHKPISFAVWH
jgi:hypothetical protein